MFVWALTETLVGPTTGDTVTDQSLFRNVIIKLVLSHQLLLNVLSELEMLLLNLINLPHK